MKTLLKNGLIRWLLILNLLALLFWGVRAGLGQLQTSREQAALENRTANRIERFGMSSKDDFERIEAIRHRIQDTQGISTEDFAFLTDLLRRGPIQEGASQRSALNLTVASILGKVPRFDSGQSGRLYEAALPLLGPMPTEDEGRSALAGILLLKKANDKRAVPRLEPLKHHANPMVRSSASNLIRYLEGLS